MAAKLVLVRDAGELWGQVRTVLRFDSRRLLVVAASVAIALNLFGFQVLSYVPNISAYDSRLITIPFRAAMLALSLLLIVLAFHNRQVRPRLSLAVFLVSAFWSLYILRIILDTVIAPQLLEHPPAEYALYAVGVSLPTLLAFLLIREAYFYKYAFGLCILLVAVACALALFSIATEGLVPLMRATTNPLMNPITLGHTGTSAILLGLFSALNLRRERPSKIRLLPSAGLVLAGLLVLLFSASKGPLLAAVVLVPVVLLLAVRGGTKAPVAALLVLALVATPFAYSYVEEQGLRLEMYLSLEAITGGTSTLGRLSLYEGAWNQFIRNPVLGSSLVERTWLTYPHNAVLEAFMATGIAGGLAFTLAVLLGIVRAFQIMRYNPEMSWLSLLFLQAVIAHMLSSSLYFAPWLWGLLGVVLGLEVMRRSMTHEARTPLHLKPVPR